MRKLLLILMIIPMMAVASIKDWSYIPYIKYSGQSPSDIIRTGRNFDFLKSLWNNPKSVESLQEEGYDMSSIDTCLLLRQGMIYSEKGIYHSAIPFIDSVSMNKVREGARKMAHHMIEDTAPQREAFLSLLDSTGNSKFAFSLAHSLVFDNLIWNHLGLSQENSTISRADSMTWNGVFYFFQPENAFTYGTNGMNMDDSHKFYFAWGENSNAYLCTVFIKSNVLKGLKNILEGVAPSEQELKDCRRFGFVDDSDLLCVPVLTGTDLISISADEWARAASSSFSRHFDKGLMKTSIGLNIEHENAAKVILYHEVLSEIDRLLDESGLIPIPSILTSSLPENVVETAQVAYIMEKN